KMPTKLDKAAPYFEELLLGIQALTVGHPELVVGSHSSSPITLKQVTDDGEGERRFNSLAQIATTELATALEDAHSSGKTTPLTKWKNAWLAKNGDNKFIFDGELENQRILALADVFDK